MATRDEAARELVGARPTDVLARGEELMEIEDPHGTGGNGSASTGAAQANADTRAAADRAGAAAKGPEGGAASMASPITEAIPPVPTVAHGRATRLLDVTLASLALVMAAPLLAVAAIAIKLTSPGPVFYRQRRVGRGGRVFELLKLRTMVVGAEHLGAGIYVTADDPRITPVGRWLRRWSIDELPNLVNVIRGEMAIVGPRPTVPAQVVRYTERQLRRLAVKPGITGWAQIHGRTELPWPERIELDLWYVEHRSLLLDLKIILRTFGLLVTGRGLYSSDLHQGFGPE